MIKTTLKTKAWATGGPKEDLKPFEIARREPGPTDVLIDIKFCGVCHSDLHQARDEWGNAIFPMVPGHEIAGVVSKVGDKVSRLKVGDHVGVGCLVDSCRTCQSCKDGLEQYCEVHAVGTYNDKEKDGTPTYGGYSKQVTVEERFVVKIPDSLPLDVAAPLLCAGITTYSPLMHWKAGPGKKVAVVGMGGLGHMAVKIASALGAHVTVLSQTLSKKADGERMGAKEYYATSDPKTFEKLQKKFDLIINTISAGMDMNAYLGLLKRDGTLVLVGAPPQSLPVDPFSLIPTRRSLAGSMIGGLPETQEMLDFCAKHKLGADIEVIPITKINEAYERMLKGDVRYRFVIDCSTIE
jgi:alcohol dehydrogenase (NADP+)